MLTTTGSSVASALRVDNNKIIGDSGGIWAESGGSVDGLDASRNWLSPKVEQKMGSNIHNHLEYLEYKGPRRVCRLCIFSGLGFQTLQAYWDQWLCYQTGRCQRIP